MTGDDQMLIAQTLNDDVASKTESGGAVTSILSCALDSLAVDGIVTLRAVHGNRFAVVPTLITNSEELLDSTGSLHFAAPNIARFVKVYLDGSPDTKLAVVGKPCDIRAIIELQKRKQIDRDNLILIGLNCTGTIPPVKGKQMLIDEFGVKPEEVAHEDISDGKLTIHLLDGTSKTLDLLELEEKGYGRRENCRRCEFNIPVYADLACGKWGTEDEAKPGTFIQVCSQKGKDLVDKAVEKGYIKTKAAQKKQIDSRMKMDEIEREKALKFKHEQFQVLDNMSLDEKQEYWFEEFSKCIKCYGCRDACPICYCDHCLLEANRQFVDPGEIPPNALFPFTRLAHVADSCVNCGQCEDACPMEIPLSKLFNFLNTKLQDVFQYIPGIDYEQPPPLAKAFDEELQVDDTFLDITSILDKR